MVTIATAIEFDRLATEDAIVTMRAITPDGVLVVMGELHEVNDRCLVVKHMHLHGEGLSPNEIGVANLRTIARAVLEGLDYDELWLEGAIRTTGAYEGHRPRPIRFTRNRRD